MVICLTRYKDYIIRKHRLGPFTGTVSKSFSKFDTSKEDLLEKVKVRMNTKKYRPKENLNRRECFRKLWRFTTDLIKCRGSGWLNQAKKKKHKINKFDLIRLSDTKQKPITEMRAKLITSSSQLCLLLYADKELTNSLFLFSSLVEECQQTCCDYNV